MSKPHTCPHCGRLVPLRLDGFLAVHHRNIPIARYSPKAQIKNMMAYCPMSGRRPDSAGASNVDE